MDEDRTDAGHPEYNDDRTGLAEPIVQKSRWEDYLDVFFAPTDLFRRRGHDKLAPPLITLLLLATAFYYILLPAQGIVMRASMKPEQLAQMPEGMLKLMPILGGISIPIVYLISTAVAAALLWLLARLVDVKPEFREMMIVATYASFIGLLSQIAVGVLTMIHGEAGLEPLRHLSFGALRFVDAKELPAPVSALLARFDIFKIWQAVVWAIGFSVVTGVSRSKGALVAGGTWLLFAVPGMLGAGVADKMGGPAGIETTVE